MIQPLNNNVILRVRISNAKVKLAGGHELFVPWGNEDERHSDVVCDVIAVPKYLKYKVEGKTPRGQNIPANGSMEWKTEMELRVGDIVIIEYLAFVTAMKENIGVFEIDGEKCFMCPYSQIYLAQRRWTPTEEEVFWKMNKDLTHFPQEILNEQSMVIKEDKSIYNVIMLNGYTLCQPRETKLKSNTIILADSETNIDTKRAKVCYVGSSNQEYMNGVYEDADVKPNDYVILDKNCDIALEAVEHLSFNGKEEYWVVQKSNILGIDNK